jgi:hypothetical protein
LSASSSVDRVTLSSNCGSATAHSSM